MTNNAGADTAESSASFVRSLGLFDATMIGIGAIQPDTGKSWEFLGKYQETAVAKAAGSFMPAFGEIPERIARHSKTPVMFVKRYEGEVKSLINKIMG